MKLTYRSVFNFFIIVITIQSGLLLAYDDKTTHKKINEEVVIQSTFFDTFLKKNLGLSDGINQNIEASKIKEWIEKGGREEDTTFPLLEEGPNYRYLRHFHDPLLTWDKSGLWSCDSAILWAMKNTENPLTFNNLYSWPMARKYFYGALTGENSEHNYAELFRALGQLMHLMSDAAVPAHVRNDVHPGYGLGYVFSKLAADPYELWAKKNYKDTALINYNAREVDSAIFSRADLGQTPSNPISALWDQNLYMGANPLIAWSFDLGLAEFSNANFLSDNTIFNNYPYPRLNETNYNENIWLNPEKVDAEDGIEDLRVYFRKNTGEPIQHFFAAEYWYYQLYIWSKPELQYAYTLDEKCYVDYAAKLIPRAVGYSTALLNYFFRGNFSVSEAFLERNEVGEITGLDLKAKNASKLDEESPEIEPFGPGNIALCCKYIPPGAEEPVYSLVEDVYTIHNAGDAINSDYVPIHANFADPIPPKVTDLSFTLVFRGELGREADAVAARAFKFTSRIAYQYQPGGSGTTSNIYTILPDGTDNRQITDAKDPNPYYFSPKWSLDGCQLAFNREICTTLGPDGFCASGCLEREIWVTNRFPEAVFPGNIVKTLDFWDPDHFDYPNEYVLTLFSFSPDSSRIVAIATNFVASFLVMFDISNGSWEYVNGFDYWRTKRLYGSAPAWSPLGDTIAYYNHREGPIWEKTGDIFLISLDGGGEIKLTSDGNLNTQPAWTPDGEQILFVSDRDGEGVMDIWITDLTGDNKRKLLDCDRNCFSPSFSPDGQDIAFEKGGDIYTVNISGQGLHRVTISGFAGSPSWSPWIFEASAP